MKIDFVPNINAYGESLVRLFDFNSKEATLLREAIKEWILIKEKPLELDTLEFVKPQNCSLTFRLSEEDEGIISAAKRTFFCDLTPEGYENLLQLIEPFCHKETVTHQYLYDLDIPVDLLFSPAGTSVPR